MHLLRISIFLLLTVFMSVGCTDAIVGAAAEAIVDNVGEEEVDTVESGDTLKLLKIENNFSMEWDKIGDEYNEVIYTDAQGSIREAIMIGSSPQVRRYLCNFEEQDGDTIYYLCEGTGTPELGDSSNSGTIRLTFKEGTEYAFFVNGENIKNILVYTRDNLYINTP